MEKSLPVFQEQSMKWDSLWQKTRHRRVTFLGDKLLYSFHKHLLNSEPGPGTGDKNRSSHIPCSSWNCVGRPPRTWTGDLGAVWHAVRKARARSYGNAFKRDLRGLAAANMHSVLLYSALHVHLRTPPPSLLLGCRCHISTCLFCLQGLSYSRCFLNN